MTSTQREMLRNAILSAMEASGAYAQAAPVLVVNLRQTGFPQIEEEEIRTELAYLRDKGFAEPVQKAISPENARWRITAGGRDHLATEGLA